jgi:Ankyrin repeat
VANMLLQADPSLINLRALEEKERTPRHLASEAGKSVSMINLLLGHRADAALMTSGLKLTPLDNFISNQRTELNVEILKVLLGATKKVGYVLFSSDKWNVLHYATTRAAVLDAKSLPGHLLLQNLATLPDMKPLVASNSSVGWTPLHLASHFVDYTTVKLQVEEFDARVDARIPKNGSAFDTVLERARQFPNGLHGADSLRRWSRLAYRSALFLQEKLEAIEGPYHLTSLHIAAYMAHYEEVVRLAREDSKAVFETNWDDETSHQMLQNTLPVNISGEWAVRFRNIAVLRAAPRYWSCD